MKLKLCGGSLLLILLLAGSVSGLELATDSVEINNGDLLLTYIRTQIATTTDDYTSLGFLDSAIVGVDSTGGMYPYTYFRMILHPENLYDSISGTITGGGIRFNVEVASDAAGIWIDVYRLDSTKGITELGGAFGGNYDCGTNWRRYIEGHTPDNGCTDANWSLPGGDYYAAKLDSFQLPTSTGAWTWTFGDSLLAYWQRLMDEDHVDTSGDNPQRYFGAVLCKTRTEGVPATNGPFIRVTSDNADANYPVMYFLGSGNSLTDLNAPVETKQAVHEVGYSETVHEVGKSKIIHEKGIP